MAGLSLGSLFDLVARGEAGDRLVSSSEFPMVSLTSVVTEQERMCSVPSFMYDRLRPLLTTYYAASGFALLTSTEILIASFV